MKYISFQQFLTFCSNMSTRRLFGDKYSRTLSIANINFLEKISTKSRNLMFNVLRNVKIVTFAKIKCARNLLICVLVEIRTCTKVTIDIIIAFISVCVNICWTKLNLTPKWHPRRIKFNVRKTFEKQKSYFVLSKNHEKCWQITKYAKFNGRPN